MQSRSDQRIEQRPINVSRYCDKPSFTQSLGIAGKKISIEIYTFKEKSGSIPSISTALNFKFKDGKMTPVVELAIGEMTFSHFPDTSSSKEDEVIKIYEEMYGKKKGDDLPAPRDPEKELIISKEILHHTGKNATVVFSNPEGRKGVKLTSKTYNWNTEVTIEYIESDGSGESAKLYHRYVTREIGPRDYTITFKNLHNEDWELSKSTYKNPEDYNTFVAPPKNRAHAIVSQVPYYNNGRLFAPEIKHAPIQSIGDYPLPEIAILNSIFGKDGLVKKVESGNSRYGHSVTINFNNSFNYLCENKVKNFISDIPGAELITEPYSRLTIAKDIESFSLFTRKYEEARQRLIDEKRQADGRENNLNKFRI